MQTKCLLISAVVLACLILAGSCSYAVTITNLSPAAYQTIALQEGVTCYIDSSDVITSAPLALKDGTLIRTSSLDATNPALTVSFNIDIRSEVYVCYDSRAGAPAWLSSWVATDMVVGVDSGVEEYRVYAKRFNAGAVQLSANQAEVMYFVVVKDSVPVFPHSGWVLLSYDMPYLREIIKKAPDYNVNHIQISHDIMMNTYEVLEQPTRRQNINELIDLAHAYGVPEVTLWTHEVCTHGMPSNLYASDGRSDGNNPALWEWIKQRYIDLFTPGLGCPEADGVVLTFSEVDDNVYLRNEFKHDGYTEAESVAVTVNTLQQACSMFGKTLYARTWVGFDKWAEDDIRDGILINGDPNIWMMNKNVGGIDWPIMDSHHAMIGTLPPEYKELIEFDLGFEYFGKGNSTGCMTSYLKYHWNYCLARNADGAVARIDRDTNQTYYTSNRLNFYALKCVMEDPNINPLEVNLEWCQQYFPEDIAQDIADHYDDPYSHWEGDTRYMMWEAYSSSNCTITKPEALAIAYDAIERVYQHRAKLELQTTLNTRDSKNDFETLRSGIADAIAKLGGTTPDSQAPSVPSNVQASALSTTSIQVTWTASTDNVGVTGYRIFRNGVYVGASTVTNYTDTGLTQNTTYSYTVLAYDARDNKSAQSSPPKVATTTAGDNQPPSAPSSVQAAASSASSVNVSWTASTDNIGVAGYRIYRNGSQVGTSVTTGYSDTGLQAISTYSYTVSAYDGDGNHSALSSPPAVATTTVDVDAPSAPTNLAAVDQSATVMRLTWTASTDNVGVAGYRIYRNSVPVGTSWSPSYVDGGLSSGVRYSYRVSGYDAAGNSSPQSEQTTARTSWFSSADLGSSNVNYNLANIQNSDGDTTPTTSSGLSCLKPVGTGDQYFYFSIHDDFLHDEDGITTYLEVCYYDDQSSSVYMQAQYDAIGDGIPNRYRGGANIYFTNTGKWKTAAWTLTECKFANRQNVGADFRIYVGAYSVKIDSVRLSKAPFVDYNSVQRDLGNKEAYKGLSHPLPSDGDTTVVTIGGRDCRKPYASGDNYFYFNVSDAIIYDGSSPTVYLKVEYYDSSGGQIKPEYDSTSGTVSGAVLNFTGTNTWKSAVWTLTNCRFANNLSSSSDFRLYVGPERNVHIDKVTVSKTPFDDEAPSVPTNVVALGLSPSVIRVMWTASTDNIEVTGYNIYRNGAQVGTSTTAAYTDTGLQADMTYSYSVSAYDAAENESAQSSPAAVATTMAASAVAAIKALPDTSPVGLAAKPVTAIFDGFIYVGEPDRYSAIRVVPLELPTGLSTGDLVDVGGVMDTTPSGERFIGGATVMESG